jgi:uncharacterized protein YmfQ (DUF2313 family)
MPYAPIFTTEDYLQALEKLLPRGPVWQTDPDSIQAKTERGLVAAWWRVNVADYNLLVDAFPASAVGLLPEWEATLGLPDPCIGEGGTISQRQKLVVAKLTNGGGQSAQYYIDLLASYGYAITITNFSPFRAGQSHAGDPLGGPWSFYTFQVNAPLNSIAYFRAGAGRAGDPLQTWGNAVLECIVNELKPAHVVVVFSYS